MGKSGSNTTTANNNYDPVASAKMAEIADRQQSMAEDQWKEYKDYFQNYEIEVAKANNDLLPFMSASTKEQLQYQQEAAAGNRKLLPAATELAQADLEGQKPVTEKFYKESLEGVNVNDRMDSASNEVKAAVKLGGETRRREASRYGIDPTSSAFVNAENTASLETAKGVAGARTAEKDAAEKENYARLGMAIGKQTQNTVGTGGINTVNNADPATRAIQTYNGAASTYAPLATRVLSSSKDTPSAGFMGFLGNMMGQAGGAFASSYGENYALGGKQR
ncbi:MAG: hypothetical protein M0009_12880 [Deltaproteobacteria bacterium]|nr:hypothetical protein [Deltaproteobacteria bacterium]